MSQHTPRGFEGFALAAFSSPLLVIWAWCTQPWHVGLVFTVLSAAAIGVAWFLWTHP